MPTDNTIIIDRDYTDNFAIKNFTINNLIAKYFPNTEVSERTVGMLGFVTEQTSNIGEDAFNAGSVYFREAFPNRAQIPESIYSHAALFQLSDVFSTACTCNFLFVMEESSILKNMLDNYDKDTGFYYFYIDKNTTFYVEEIPFTIDYDIEMRIAKKVTETGEDYIFTASYMVDEYKNSISAITDPYIKIRRSGDGYIALEIRAHQCTRDVREEPIITNSVVNYPVVDIAFEGKLAGFDILYKTSTETSYNTQMEKEVVFAQPLTTPFVYYQMKDTKTLRLTFNTKDNYFMPEYNSSLQVILYLTDGSAGKFDVYTGKNIKIVPSIDKYAYSNTYIVAANVLTASTGGVDQLDIDALQALTVSGYRTANALTTENDLQEFFSNYKYLYGNSDVVFIKKRDDVYERVYSAFLVMRNEDYIFKTNTLNLKCNLGEMQNPETSIYMLEPGLLFTSNENDGCANFLRDEETSAEYHAAYLQAVKDGTIPYIEDVTQEDLPAYLRRPASFAEYKRRNGLDDKLSIFDMSIDDLQDFDDPIGGKFCFINPFLIRFKKNPNLISLYMTFINETSLVDFTAQNEDAFVQFIMYQCQVKRLFTKEKKYSIAIRVTPSISIDNEYPVIKGALDEDEIMIYELGDRYNVVNNDLRIIFCIKDGNEEVCFAELYPDSYDYESAVFEFKTELFTDDHITSDGKVRILDGIIYRNPVSKDYYKEHSDDSTLYYHYDEKDNLVESSVPVDDVTALINAGTIKKYTAVYNISNNDDITVPMTDVRCEIFMLYRRVYSEADGKLVLTTDEQGNNRFMKYDPTLSNYIWTNQYNTDTEHLTFLKPLNSVRSNLEFEDYSAATKDDEGNTVFLHDIMDVGISSIPFIRWDLAKDEEKLTYFMNTFYSQYLSMIDIINTRLRNCTNIDVKFYNTYGRSKNFRIGEEDEVLDTVNLKLEFDMWFIAGTDLLAKVPEVKAFIKEQVETVNSRGMNNLYLSNLMRKIESTFAYVDHIRFNHINNYITDYQAVKNYVTDLDDLTVEERRVYVPELLVVDIDDIIINEYFVQ